jgi:hypothetical protein
MSRIIDESLQIKPEEKELETIPTRKPEKGFGDDLENDYQYARENFYDIVEKGSEALMELLEVARQTESPRAYEVLSTMMKTLVEANKDLVTISQKKRDGDIEHGTQSVTNNNLIITTTDLQKMIQNVNEENI